MYNFTKKDKSDEENIKIAVESTMRTVNNVLLTDLVYDFVMEHYEQNRN